MRRFQSLAARWMGTDGRRSPPWRCQLVLVETLVDALVIDLVALDDCPANGITCPRHSPFSIRIGRPLDMHDSWDRPIRTWAGRTDELAITCGVERAGGPWICLSGAAGDLVLHG